MAIFESLFDLIYLAVVIGLGSRLFLEKKKGAKLFGIMALLLGAGDAFHLIPRVVSHLSPLGFEGHRFSLSWGQFITGITMTVFYLLYYHFYRRQSGDSDHKKAIAVYALALIRIVLSALPQNKWGQADGSYLFGIYRNIPFAIMGALLIFWSYRERKKDGLKHMWLLILLSFIFYIPVVLWSKQIPAIGALMMPKTVAYLLIVSLGYKYFVGPYNRINILGIAFANLIMGLTGGVFYREFTKFYQFTGPGHLGKLHVHTLVLGFVIMTLIYLLSRGFNQQQLKKLKKPIYTFEAGLIFTVINMMLLGMYEVVGAGQGTINRSAADGLSGMGHIILAVGLVMTFVRIFNLEKTAGKNLEKTTSTK